jgi:uncharacterized protein YjcR
MIRTAEERERARFLYIVEGQSFVRVAAETGISKNTLQRWSAEEGWQEIKKFRNEKSSKPLMDFLEIRRHRSLLLRRAALKKERKLNKQRASISPKVLSALTRLADATAFYFQPLDKGDE